MPYCDGRTPNSLDLMYMTEIIGSLTGWMCCYPRLLHEWGACNARSALIYRTRLHGQTCILCLPKSPNQSALLNGVTPSLSDQPLVESSNPVHFNVGRYHVHHSPYANEKRMLQDQTSQI
ncbi:hypothetical protein LB503_008153 [Fusarium chuoi]|nr:hypothetical protein LB503_008153 [Fusarium chuoi]